MDYFPSGVGALRQLYPENVPLNISTVGHRLNHYVHRQEEVFCPEPRRIVGKNFAADTPNRLCSKHRSFVARRWEAPEIFDIILSSDDSDSDLSSPRQLGFLCGSPPIRSSNPVALDSKFEKGSLPPSPLANSYGAPWLPLLPTTAEAAMAAESARPSCDGGNPRVRIEGFTPVTAKAWCK